MKKGSILKNVLAGCLFLLGIAFLFYPAVGNYWNEQREKQLINTYEENVSEIAGQDFEALFAAARAYNEKQKSNVIPDAFAAGENLTDEEYEGLLNYGGEGIMGILEIPAIDIRIPILHGTGEEALTKGAGHMEGSSLPIGGRGTHAAMAAHRGLPSSKLFTDLNLLREGDLFYIHVLDRVLTYEVDRILEVEPDETQYLKAEPEEDYVTLITCTPYGVNTHRLLVRGSRVETMSEETEIPQEPVRVSLTTNYFLNAVLAMAATAVIAVLILVLTRKTKKTE